MLIINPQVCIDCGVCIPECPVDAIEDDSKPTIWMLFNENSVSAGIPVGGEARAISSKSL
ncbi:4Fe-4S binding protein [Rhizobium leguminosarum]|uniref:4Fe-4S dicluster domain-containing protein n=1 Tax=Rhizobium leguminosarum TaxID=384 RepID=UPI0009B7A854